MGSADSSGSSQVQESQAPDSTFLNPAAAVLANMFGIGVGVKDGGLQYTGLTGGGGPFWQGGGSGGGNFLQSNSPLPDELSSFLPAGMGYRPEVGWKRGIDEGSWSEADNYFSKRIFGPDSFADVADLANYENLGAEGARGVMGGWDDYLSKVSGTLEEGLDTGFRTNMDPIIAEMQRIYRDETMPQIAQQYAGQTGSFSTDFLAANSRAGGAMGSQLGALQAQMDEAASNRRASLLPMAGMPAELASLGLQTGSQFELMGTPGGQQATLLQMLAGLQPTAAIPRGNTSRSQGAQQSQGVTYGGGGGGKG